jgi:hypothetical protein
MLSSTQINIIEFDASNSLAEVYHYIKQGFIMPCF